MDEFIFSDVPPPKTLQSKETSSNQKIPCSMLAAFMFQPRGLFPPPSKLHPHDVCTLLYLQTLPLLPSFLSHAPCCASSIPRKRRFRPQRQETSACIKHAISVYLLLFLIVQLAGRVEGMKTRLGPEDGDNAKTGRRKNNTRIQALSSRAAAGVLIKEMILAPVVGQTGL